MAKPSGLADVRQDLWHTPGICVRWLGHIHSEDGLGAESRQRCWGFYGVLCQLLRGKATLMDRMGFPLSTLPRTCHSSEGLNILPNGRMHRHSVSNPPRHHIHHHKHVQGKADCGLQPGKLNVLYILRVKKKKYHSCVDIHIILAVKIVLIDSLGAQYESCLRFIPLHLFSLSWL